MQSPDSTRRGRGDSGTRALLLRSEVSSEAASEAKLGVQDVHQSERGDPHRDRKGEGKARGPANSTEHRSRNGQEARRSVLLGSLSIHCKLSLPVGHSRYRCELGPGSSPPAGRSLERLTSCPLVAIPEAGTNHSLKEGPRGYCY